MLLLFWKSPYGCSIQGAWLPYSRGGAYGGPSLWQIWYIYLNWLTVLFFLVGLQIDTGKREHMSSVNFTITSTSTNYIQESRQITQSHDHHRISPDKLLGSRFHEPSLVGVVLLLTSVLHLLSAWLHLWLRQDAVYWLCSQIVWTRKKLPCFFVAVSSRIAKYENSKLVRILKSSKCHKARLLHYFPALSRF